MTVHEYITNKRSADGYSCIREKPVLGLSKDLWMVCDENPSKEGFQSFPERFSILPRKVWKNI
jgi:hypothetical protein